MPVHVISCVTQEKFFNIFTRIGILKDDGDLCAGGVGGNWPKASARKLDTLEIRTKTFRDQAAAAYKCNAEEIEKAHLTTF